MNLLIDKFVNDLDRAMAANTEFRPLPREFLAVMRKNRMTTFKSVAANRKTLPFPDMLTEFGKTYEAAQ